MAFERDLEGAFVYVLGSLSPPLPQQDAICLKQEASMGNSAVQNTTDTSSFLGNHLPSLTHLCLYPQSYILFTSIDSIYMYWSTQTPHWTEGKTTVGHRKWGRPQPVPSWRDHSHSSEKVKQRAKQRQRQYSAPIFRARVQVPKRSACVHVHGPSLLWLQLFKPEHPAAEYHLPDTFCRSPSLPSTDQFPKPRLACLLSSLPELPVTSELCLCPLCHP